MEREFEVVLHGASGFTGRIVAEHLQQRYGQELKWAIAGRDQARLERVRAEIGADGLPLIVADASDDTALGLMTRRTRAVIAAAGPYTLYGSGLLAACVNSGTDYVDITGELNWISSMLAHDAAAKASGARILFCCGFNSIPFDLGVYFTQQAAQRKFGAPASRVRARLRHLERGVHGGISGGSLASAMQIGAALQAKPELMAMVGDPFAFTPGLRGADQPDATKAYDDPSTDCWVVPFNGAFINSKIVHRSNLLLGHRWGRDFRYDEMRMSDGPPTGTPEPPRYYMVNGQLPKPGEGPSKADRAGTATTSCSSPKPRTANAAYVRGAAGSTPAAAQPRRWSAKAPCALPARYRAGEAGGGIRTSASLMGDALIARLEANAEVTFRSKASASPAAAPMRQAPSRSACPHRSALSSVRRSASRLPVRPSPHRSHHGSSPCRTTQAQTWS